VLGANNLFKPGSVGYRVALGRAATIAAVAVGLVIFNAAPVVIGGLVAADGLGEATAANLVTAEFLAIALASLAAAARVERQSLRTLAFLGATIACGAQLASAFLLPANRVLLGIYFGLRVLAGIGEGLLLCAANGALARTRNAARVYAIAMFLSNVCSAVFFDVVPALQSRSPGSAFLVLSGTLLAALPLLLCLESTTSLKPRVIEPGGLVFSWLGLSSLASVFLYSSALGALWAFSELIGTHLGLSREQAGQALALNLVAGLGGAGLAAVVNNRLGYLWPFVTGTAALAGASLVLGLGHSVVGFVAAQIVYGVLYPFTMSLMMAQLAELDSRGRLVASAGGVLLIGFAVGPAIGAILVQRGGLAPLGIVVSSALLGSGLILAGRALIPAQDSASL
jgi:hypothetical protein